MRDHYDVIVCGAGPAGVTASLAAALAAAKDGDIRGIAINELQNILRGNGIGI